MAYITNETFLALLLRVILGILFFFQGFDKIFNIKMSGVISFFKQETKDKNIPSVFLSLSAYLSSYIELLGGLFLIIGLFKTWALYFLGIDLIMVCIAFSFLKPMWDMNLVFPRIILLVMSLYIPVEWDILSIDYLLVFLGK